MPTDKQAAPEWVADGWLVRQLHAWPHRVDPDRTTSVKFLMQEAAIEIERLPTQAGERIAALEEALRNLLDFIGDRDMRVYASDLVVREARTALNDGEAG